MELKKISIFVLIILTAPFASAQFDKPQFQLGFGVSEPYNDLRGTYYSSEILGSFYVQTINPDFMTNNYGGKTGLNFLGKAKINFDKYSIVRGVLGANFATFNTFESSQNGNIGVVVQNINGVLDTLLTSISNNYTFGNFGIGLGLEIAPTSFTNVVSPYFGGSLSFNFMNGDLSRTENGVDTVTLSFSDFRMGFTFDAGIEAKVNSSIGLALGVKYDLGNLLFQNTSSGISYAIEYGKSNASINDAEGRFFSSIYGPVISSVRKEVQGKKKEINWGTIYLGVNFNFNTPKTTKPKTQKPKS